MLSIRKEKQTRNWYRTGIVLTVASFANRVHFMPAEFRTGIMWNGSESFPLQLRWCTRLTRQSLVNLVNFRYNRLTEGGRSSVNFYRIELNSTIYNVVQLKYPNSMILNNPAKAAWTIFWRSYIVGCWWCMVRFHSTTTSLHWSQHFVWYPLFDCWWYSTLSDQ